IKRLVGRKDWQKALSKDKFTFKRIKRLVGRKDLQKALSKDKFTFKRYEPKSQETLGRPRSVFRIARTQTRYDRVPDRSKSRSGSPISAYRSTTVNGLIFLVFSGDCSYERGKRCEAVNER
ncbi:hypothetical protein Tco_1397067, partial [Tanacetum coccineum]